MNKQPVYYMQTDTRWKNKPYRVTGESSTIGGSGCGPTCAAMLIETLTGKTFTPEDACNWSMEHGYKALNQGTYYSYFVPQFKEFGIDCQQLNWSNLYGNPNDETHEKAFDLLKQGYYIIACMGKGMWTSSGHFVVVWWEDGKVKINDPNSKAENRTNGDLQTFKNEVKYYWAVDARSYNMEDDMNIEKLTDEELVTLANKIQAALSKKDAANWGKEWETAQKWAENNGIIKGDENGNKSYQAFTTRQALALMLYRLEND